MATYTTSSADVVPAPATYPTEPRYLGYRDEDLAQPYAKYFRQDALPMPQRAADALLSGMTPTEYGYDIDDAARVMSRPGHHKMETGWTTLDNGVVSVAVLTDMPGVTAEMWDWWFAWHSCESARYKLWHPDSHQYSAVGDPRLADRTLTDRQKYQNNVSYVDEYIGGVITPLTVRFVDPVTLGFDEPRPGGTVVAGRVGLSVAPVAFGWVVHQVRPTDSGAEMRSRFFLNHPQHLDLPADSVTAAPAGRPAPGVPDFGRLAVDLLSHCAVEMNHLASFLPALYEEFRNTP